MGKSITFLQWLAGAEADTMVALCTQAPGYLFIAPKSELISWLYEPDHRDYVKRNVIETFYEPTTHKGYVVRIEGDEKGAFFLREEVLRARGEDVPTRMPKQLDENGCIRLLGAVISEFLNDIADMEVFDYFNFRGIRTPIDLNKRELEKYNTLSWAEKKAWEFLLHNDAAKLSREEIKRGVRKRVHQRKQIQYRLIFQFVPIDKYNIHGKRWSRDYGHNEKNFDWDTDN